MIIHGLTVCVDFADHLSLSLGRWKDGLAGLTVVTTWSDLATRDLCLRAGVQVIRTDAFYRNGAAFNKGLAMEEARQEMPWSDWILFFDADIVPALDWRSRLTYDLDGVNPSISLLHPGYLYGTRRYEAPAPHWIDDPSCNFVNDDRVGYGYFQLFHALHPFCRRTPLLDTHWRHAGNYDSNFLLSWKDQVREVQVPLWHLGERGNWYGRFNHREFVEMERKRSGMGIHPSEHL